MAEIEYKRWATKSIQEALAIFRTVFIAGARQCGKTTLAKQIHVPSDNWRTLDNSAQRKVATEDPAGFIVRRDAGPMVIDEIQKVPALLPEIKRQVDEDTSKGQYLLTGSANILNLPAITESLAGRMGTIRLRTLAHGEIVGNSPTFLQRSFNHDFQSRLTGYTKRDVLALAFRGGYGETLELSPRAKKLWFKSYLDALLLHDVRELMDVRAYHVLRQMMEMMLAYSAKFFTEESFTTALGIKHETFVRFLSILKTLYLVDEVPAWHQGDYDGLNKRSKYFVSDTGLIASMLNWREEDVYLDSDRSGKLVESWVYNQLTAQTDLAPDFAIYQYRDKQKREIDFIIVSDDGKLLGIEVKAGSDVGESDFRALKWFRDNLAKDRPFTGVVVYTGELTLPFGQSLYAIPIGEICA